jgi:thiol-disulfide isomerase/thioredoxin
MIGVQHRRSYRFAVALFAAYIVIAAGPFAAAQQAAKNLVLHSTPKPVAAISFDDGQGQTRSLTESKGKVVLLNIWATWCVPCRHEMPALDRLQTALGGADFEVVAVSIDRSGKNVVAKFFAEVGIQKLAMRLDSAGKATRELGVFGLPTTLLLDRDGREIGRLVGPAEWDAPEIIEFIRCVISTGNVTQSAKETNSAAASSCSKPGLSVPANGTSGSKQP